MRTSGLRPACRPAFVLGLAALAVGGQPPALAQAGSVGHHGRVAFCAASASSRSVKSCAAGRRASRISIRTALRARHGRTRPAAHAKPRPVPAPAPAPAPTPAPTPIAPPVTSAGGSNAPLYWGAWIGSSLTGTEAPWDVNAITTFARDAGKAPSIVNFSSPFANCSSSPCTNYDFPAGEFTTIRNQGAIPFFSWATDSLPVSGDQTPYRLSSIIAGSQDAYITAWATAARNWGHPFFLRFNWEMNGNWFPWVEGRNGNTAGESVAAWRHVHDIFTRVGATNVTWVWCPNIDPGNVFTSLSSLYPGDAYVDWTALDGYNWNTPWTSFTDLFKSTYDQITTTIAPDKPLIVGETASTEAGGSKAQWITDMFQALPTRFPKIRGLLWFDKIDEGMDWPIETSVGATAAFRAGIQDARFVANTAGSLAPGPIAPPAG